MFSITPIDVVAIVIGLLGTVLNGLLLWVIKRNRSIDEKCSPIYKSLAIVDIFNCIVIPLCFVTIDGSGYNTKDIKATTNSIMYLIFGAMIDVPYLMLMILTSFRIMILRYQSAYSQALKLMHIRVMCILCWLIPLAGTLGVWIFYLLTGYASSEILTIIMKAQGCFMMILILSTISLMSMTVNLINKIIKAITKNDSKAPLINEEIASEIEDSSVSSQQTIARELKFAHRTFSLFLSNILIFSIYPFVFSLSFIFCGPDFQSKKTFCLPIQSPVFSNPLYSYAITLICLCGMSIINSLILLQQKSFTFVLKQLWLFRIQLVRSGYETLPDHQQPDDRYIQEPGKQREVQHPGSKALITNLFETPQDMHSTILPNESTPILS